LAAARFTRRSEESSQRTLGKEGKQMEKAEKKPFDGLAHTVNSKCAALCEAANVLPRISPQRADKMLGLMADQARDLEAAILTFRKALSNGVPS
jgi:geranylgeranyl pyrophosphate synthase